MSTGNEIRLPIGDGHGRLAVVEEEDRLELRLRGAQEAQPALLRAGMRPLVRQHGSGGVRLDPSEATRPSRRRAIPSGPDVVLGDAETAGSSSRTRTPSLEPGPEQSPASSSESFSVRWTTLWGLVSGTPSGPPWSRHVVGRRDRLVEGARTLS